ncbi:MAG: DUF3987 domain-containing protein, partial [Deltaproteobacteria bacterium]|nr:DUF3987 domain-containing protein [Deltaproteobacteria bacterium]
MEITNSYINDMTRSPAPSPIEEALALLCAPDQVVELRILNTPKGTVSGYFTDWGKLAAIAHQWSGRCGAVYITLNPVVSSLLARAANRIIDRARTTTSDTDIVRRRWLLLDLDPKRPAGISSTDAEHQAALDRATECLRWLRSLGFTAYILADSGNGAHILLRIDLPNDQASTDLVKRCLAAVALHFSDDTVVVDLTVYNGGRIGKLYGTLSCKGDNTSDRPHRLSRILEVSETLEPVPRSLLETLAALVPDDPQPAPRHHRNGTGAFDLQGWIGHHHLDVIGPHSWKDGQKWIFPVCPFNADHNNRAAVLLQFGSGAIAFRCLHNGCVGNDWHALRELLEPGWRAQRPNTGPDDEDGPIQAPHLSDLVEPFPLEALPPTLRDLVKAGAETIHCPVDYIAVPLLALAGGAIGATRVIEIKRGWRESAALFTAIVAMPGAKKSPALKLASTPVHHYQAQLSQAYKTRLWPYRVTFFVTAPPRLWSIKRRGGDHSARPQTPPVGIARGPLEEPSS